VGGVDAQAVTRFFALLAIAAEAAVAAAVLLTVAGRVSARAERWRRVAAATVGPDGLRLAFVVAAVCTAGSLYLSEVAHFPPCFLCWVQRGFMYPLVPFLAVAAWRRWYGVGRWVAVWAGLGGAVSAYHVLVERFPSLESTSCDPTNPCWLIWVEHFGYLTIPTMALSGFALIAVLALTARPPRPAGDDADHDDFGHDDIEREPAPAGAPRP
jgi:disulfide bond formation protein DsbB